MNLVSPFTKYNSCGRLCNPGPAAAEVFSDKLKAYKTGKGTIRLFYHEPLRLELIAEIAGWCEKEYGE
ncbi:hypothetical protein [Murimonas intestini]|uniref:hypothetical protein n=1 Tax=Murimonas intestini TaxID=1337051 RepID=UPI0011DDD18C|nr:hypothetical protein [Murimonas intestini]